jgi:ABC-2 type transport system ATP-binding protein
LAKVLRVSNLRKAYGDAVAVDDVSFSLAPNEIVGLLGPNGAGKTTTINMILGVLEPTSGSIEIDGIPLAGNLTVEQNLRFFGLVYGVTVLSQRLDVVFHEFELERFRNTKCGVLSSGEQTRVALAKAMLNLPKVLLLDEPTASLDPATARDIRARIRSFASRGECCVLWTSHNMFEVRDVCDRVLFLSHGKVLLEGDPRTLPADHGKETLEELFITVAREPLTLELE